MPRHYGAIVMLLRIQRAGKSVLGHDDAERLRGDGPARVLERDIGSHRMRVEAPGLRLYG